MSPSPTPPCTFAPCSHCLSLLDVLAQRKDFGEIRGSILIDGKPQGVSFQRMTGYCEQMDVHEGTSTVKEALVFSALLRQPRSVSEAEKLAYVEHIIDLLELRDICDALIGGVYLTSPTSRTVIRRLLTFNSSWSRSEH